MRRSLILLLSTWLILISNVGFSSKDEALDALLSRLDQWNANAPQEKVHLHFDKPYYSLGEDMWFKAYVVDAKENHLSDRSRILYVDFLDERDSVKQTLLLPVVNGMANGNIHLSDSILTAGNYHIYAYTKWMQNFGSGFFFKKEVHIVNALHGAVTGNLDYKAVLNKSGKTINANITFTSVNGNTFSDRLVNYVIQANGKEIANSKALTDAEGKLVVTTYLKPNEKIADIAISTTLTTDQHRTQQQTFVIKALANNADVKFFPEGGHLVSGIRTKVAFKAVKPDGLGENISGYLIEEGSSDHLAEFRSDHAGMGVFAMLPQTDKIYSAVITHEDGTTKSYRLTKAEISGYVLNVNHIGKDSLSIKVSASADLLNDKEAVLIAQCNGLIKFVAKPKLDQASILSYIPTKRFPTGIVQFTLFTPNMQPVAERLVFVQHNNQLDADLKTDRPEYTKRGKVNLDLNVKDNTGNEALGSFSVAVTDAGKVKTDEDNETTILSNLLLTSDIKGYVEQPNYYFNANNSQREKQLDELLLTQGWRRFSWVALQANKPLEIKYQPEKSLEVTGRVITLGNDPVAKGKVALFAKTNKGMILTDTLTDESGHFVFDNLDFADSSKLIIRAVNAKNNEFVKALIDQKPRIQYPAISFASAEKVKGNNLAEYTKATRQQFEELSKYGLMKNAVDLKEVKITAPKEYDKFTQAKIIPHSSNIDPGHADYVIKADKLEHETHLLDAFYNIPGIDVNVSQGVVYSTRAENSITGHRPMTVILDGAFVDATRILTGIIPSDIEGVEFLTGTSKTIYGSAGAQGVIIITTKRGGDHQPPPPVNVAHYTPQGYTPVKEYYAPAYDKPDRSKMTDLRSTIYWNPNVVTDANGHANISYFNADGTGTYKVTIEGMDTRGGLLRKTFTYVVK